MYDSSKDGSITLALGNGEVCRVELLSVGVGRASDELWDNLLET